MALGGGDNDRNSVHSRSVVSIDEGFNETRNVFLELYRYENQGPDREVYGHDHLQYEVRAHRYRNSIQIMTLLNDHSEETTKELEKQSDEWRAWVLERNQRETLTRYWVSMREVRRRLWSGVSSVAGYWVVANRSGFSLFSLSVSRYSMISSASVRWITSS